MIATAAITETTERPKSWKEQQREIPPSKVAGLYDRANIKAGEAFRMSDGAAYGRTAQGAFILLNKDARSVKERKRARRELRNRQNTP